MVVPIDRMSAFEKTKKYVGNNLSVAVKCNTKKLVVIGNNCKVECEENLGQLRIVGDNNKVIVTSGNGGIEYIGNCGKVCLGDSVLEKNTTFTGNNIKISSRRTDKCKSDSVESVGSVNICNANRVHLSNTSLPSCLTKITKIRK
ncbi:unnamed protein product [Brassicogethes aeneus]|uniref:Uncharacterized protein n=1 Tax=Brassicogethes aeneus TaxID=1431903 RepID=A0A9P0FJW8_BRAAE|nr:unnamed protein product [Brassicogethes aeneus]